jgi:pimeloyl-ACP methyl ester carboxylesterase|tara:strand:+ start:1270 stop:2103 length:834 start_codon:yes stop_codon:yes gene_type:complete
MTINRAFTRIKEGEIHYRYAGADSDEILYMIHSSPASSVILLPLIEQMSSSFKVIAPDTLGFGDSVVPTEDWPSAGDYADSVIRVMDSLGIESCHFFGSHTGAHIASEVAIKHPDRVRKLVLDGIAMFSDEERKEYLEHYAPEVSPDEFGQHLVWAWNFVRDQFIYFPYFKKTSEHQRTEVSMPPAEFINKLVLEVLKGLSTYHKGYHAAFTHKDKERLPMITVETFCGASEDDPLKSGVDMAAKLIPNSTKGFFPNESNEEGLSAKAIMIRDFLRG